MKRIAIFASGSGSNAENIIRYFHNHSEITVSMVISDRKEAPVLEKARKHGVEALYFPSSTFKTGEKILDVMKKAHIDLLVLAGFLKLVPKKLIADFPKKIINIHPALLPKYGGKGMFGMHVHEAIYQNHEKETGITIHYVNEFFDAGEIIFQAKTAILPTDNPQQIVDKIRPLEMEWYPKIIEKILMPMPDSIIGTV